MSLCCKCCVLLGRGLRDELTTRPEGFYRLWCPAVCYRNLIYEEPNINQQCLNLWDLLGGGDLITLGSLQVRLPTSQHISL
jgi:hypothetical protein